MQLIHGQELADKILVGLRPRLVALPKRPILCDLLVGNDPVALSYVKIKSKTAKENGFGFHLLQLPETAREEEVLGSLAEVQSHPDLSGLIIQLPLPGHLNSKLILDNILPELDVDCIGQSNNAAFYDGQPRFLPPTAAAVMAIIHSLIEQGNISPVKHNILVIGQGELVGRPVTYLLRQQRWQVTTADRNTTDVASLSRLADVIVSGTGQPGLLRGDMVKPGAVVIDAGTAESGADIVGDIDFDSVKEVAGFLSPVPGGVGPVTVAMLLSNVLQAAETTRLS